ncbi:hypothetical protein GCM10027053_31810 [Intrasporangium mesophilum]
MTTDPTGFRPDDLEARLGAALRGRLDTVSASTDLTGPSVVRSRRIRRTRTIATSVAATVAALAVATPLAWSSLRSPDEPPFVPGTTQPATGQSSVPTQTTPPPTSGPATSTPPTSTSGTAGTSTATGQPPTGPTGSGVTAADNNRPPVRTVSLASSAPSGPAPDTAWTQGKTLHRGGTSATLDVGDPWSYVPLSAGRGVVIDSTPGQPESLRIVGPDGSTVRKLADLPIGRSAQVKANDSGTWFTVYAGVYGSRPDAGSDARITTYTVDGAVIAQKDNLRRDVTLVGLVGNKVYLANSNVDRSYVWDLDSNVIDRYTDSGVLNAVNEAAGRGALWTHDANFTTGCTEILDLATKRTIAESCGRFVPDGFSDDGDLLVGYPIGADGFGAPQVDVLDVATGRISLRIAGAVFPQLSVFLPDGRVGVNVVSYATPTASNSLQACSLDARCTSWVDTVPMPNDLETPYRLPR